MRIEVVEPGALTSVQDSAGRPGWRHLGVPVGGAADPWSARLANRIVGNADPTALLEMTLDGPTLRFEESAVVALGGRMRGSVDGLPLVANVARVLRAGAVVRIGPGDGARGYLAVGGGIAVEPVMGSPATDLRSGFGGLDGRALRAGDRLEIGLATGGPRRWTGRVAEDGPIRIVAGPHADRISERIDGRRWRVGGAADRTGVRLEGAVGGGGEVASLGLPIGAIQVPPDGHPIIMLADRPVTGGYVVPSVVITADAGRAAQLRPGDEVSFASVSLADARAARRRAEHELAALEPLDERRDDELGWIGSHE